jgi:hypothetical protein
MIGRAQRKPITLIGLIAAWLGLWGAWVPSSTASLSQNLFYLAEWSTFLPGVRSGEIRLAPEALRLAAALAAAALVFSAEGIRQTWTRWLVRIGLAVPVIIVLMPPYPDFFQLWWSPSYGARFGTASVLALALVASLFAGRLSAPARRIGVAGLCVLALASAVTGLVNLLPPFQADYAAPLGAGWGLAAFFAGLVVAALAQAAPGRVLEPLGEKQNGPVA